jgi:predicted RecB family nuclease
MITVTPLLFEAYLACPTKCFLLSTNCPEAYNTFVEWRYARCVSHRDAGTKVLATRYNPEEILRDAPFASSWVSRKSGLAINASGRAQNLATIFHAVEWGDEKRLDKSTAAVIPIRFVATNKLTRADRLLLAYDAYILTKLMKMPVAFGRIIHGDKHIAHKIRTSELEREVRKLIGKIVSLLSAGEAPLLALNRHCTECIFKERCRELAIEKDDLSLLSSLSDVERAKFNKKGIFSVTQLSYTFRPRRRSKYQVGRAEKYSHALKAMAIRENKVHLVDMLQYSFEGTPVFIDVESLPDRDFYYLIGLRWPSETGIQECALWAEAYEDEMQSWTEFIHIISSIKLPVLIHYGNFESIFVNRMIDRYGVPRESIDLKIFDSTINLLKLIFARVYFPTYSNGLKDIAGYLGFKWDDPASSGLQSIVWRHEWERLHDPGVKEKIIRYNADDCQALSVVNEALIAFSNMSGLNGASYGNTRVAHTDAVSKTFDTKWKKFKSPISGLEQINSAARWDYQRSRVYARPHPRERRPQQENNISARPAHQKCTQISWITSDTCPRCDSKSRVKHGIVSRRVRDIIFGTASLKERIVTRNFQTYLCRRCGLVYGIDTRYKHINYKYGWNYLSYVIYMIVNLCIPQYSVCRNLNRLFDTAYPRSRYKSHEDAGGKLLRQDKRRIA